MKFSHFSAAILGAWFLTVSAQANSCPDLSGQYDCRPFAGVSFELTITQTTALHGVTTYAYSANRAPEPAIHVASDAGEINHWPTPANEFTAVCEDSQVKYWQGSPAVHFATSRIDRDGNYVETALFNGEWATILKCSPRR